MIINNMAEAYAFVSEVLGEESGRRFEERLDSFVYYVKMSALTNPNVTDTWMKSKLKRYASNIIVDSIKGYLDKNFSDAKGEICLNLGFGKFYDDKLQPIDAVNKVKASQRALMKYIVSMGMFEFAKGRDIAMTMIERAMRNDEPHEPTADDLRAEILKLENKLPKITDTDADKLLSLYKQLKGS
jgi:hypothetical protein